MVGTIKGHEINISKKDATIDGVYIAPDEAKKIYDRYYEIAKLGTKRREGDITDEVRKRALADLL